MRVITPLVTSLQNMAMWTDTLQVIVPIACQTIRYVKRVLTNLNMLALKEDIKAYK